MRRLERMPGTHVGSYSIGWCHLVDETGTFSFGGTLDPWAGHFVGRQEAHTSLRRHSTPVRVALSVHHSVTDNRDTKYNMLLVKYSGFRGLVLGKF